MRELLPSERKREPEGYCEICTSPLYRESDMVLRWGPYPSNPQVGNVIVSRRCRDEAGCAARCSVVDWAKV